MGMFDNPNATNEDNLSLAVQSWGAVREALSIATRGEWAPSYDKVLDVIYALAPDVYDAILEKSTGRNESELVSLHREIASARSTTDNPVTALDSVLEEIAKFERLRESGDTDKRFIRSMLVKLNAAKKALEPRRIMEDAILRRDVFFAQRKNVIPIPRYTDERYKDFRTEDGRILRLRLLHPNADETATGADLLYELHNLKNGKVRIVYVQYKVWDGPSKSISLTQERLSKQLERLDAVACQTRFCQRTDANSAVVEFRLPYCCGFLRATNRVQKPNAAQVTRGYHVPLCVVLQLKNQVGRLTPEGIAGRSLTGKQFEKMYIGNLLGSGWVDQAELQNFYEKIGVEDLHETIRIHAQEVTNDEENGEQSA